MARAGQPPAKAAASSLPRVAVRGTSELRCCCKQQTPRAEGRQRSWAKVLGRLPRGGAERILKAALGRALGRPRAPDWAPGPTPQHNLACSPSSQLQVQPWGSERLASGGTQLDLEKAMAPHSSTLAWKIPWVEKPGGLQSMGSLRVDRTERLHFNFSLSCIGEGNGNPLQCSCLENTRDGGTRWAAVQGVAQSQTRLKRLSSSRSSSRPKLYNVQHGPRVSSDRDTATQQPAGPHGPWSRADGSARLCHPECRPVGGAGRGVPLEWHP